VWVVGGCWMLVVGGQKEEGEGRDLHTKA